MLVLVQLIETTISNTYGNYTSIKPTSGHFDYTMRRFLFYLGITLITFSVSFLSLLMVQPGFANEAIRANPVSLATILTVALLFSGGFGLILVAKISRNGVITNTPRTRHIIWTVAAIGVVVSVALNFYAFTGIIVPPSGGPQVSAILTSCSGDPEACTLSLQNIGTADGETTSNCTLTFGGTTHSATSTVQTIKAGGPSVLVRCTASAGTAPPGSQISGSISMANGGTVLFQFPAAG